MTNLDSILKSGDITLPKRFIESKIWLLSSSHAWMWELDHKEDSVLKNWCFWILVLEKTLESPLDCKEIKPVNHKGNQPWIFIGRTDAWSWSSNTLATWWEEPTHWKRLWCWERLMDANLWKLWEIVKDRESCPWVHVNYSPRVARVGHDLATE